MKLEEFHVGELGAGFESEASPSPVAISELVLNL